MKLKVKRSFRWAHGGVRIQDYVADQEIDTEDKELIDVALREGWAAKPKNAVKPSRPQKTLQ